MKANEVLKVWMGQENVTMARVKAGRGWGPQEPADVAGKSGLRVLREMREGCIPVPRSALENCYCLVQEDPGAATIQGAPDARHLNPMGTVHGGWMSTLLDSAMGSAVMSTLPPDWGYATAGLSVDFRRGLRPGVQRVRAYGRLGSSERAAATALRQPGSPRRILVAAAADLVGPDGAVYASAAATFHVFRTAPRSATEAAK